MGGSGTPGRPSSARIAVDLLGGDGGPEAVAAGVTAALRHDPELEISLVGPHHLTRPLPVGADDVAGRITAVPASQVVAMGDDPIRGVRAKRDATVCVAARLVRDGTADAMVTVGSTGAAVAAAIFTLGLLPSVTRPALAVTLPAESGPVVLLDVGANLTPTADLLGQHALLGAAYAGIRLDRDQSAVGLLSTGTEPGKGDRIRRAAAAVLATLPIRFVGNVEGGDVARGGRADVVVTDGFTGNVLLKAMEGTYAVLAGLVSDSLGAEHVPARDAIGRSLGRLHPDRLAGALLLGVDGVVVVGHGASSPAAVAACIGQAAAAARQATLPKLRAALPVLAARRRGGAPAAAVR